MNATTNKINKTNIPVYVSHDGECYDGFIKTVTAKITPYRAGIDTEVKTVNLRRVKSRNGYRLKALPCNYKTLTRLQIFSILYSVQYNYMMHSLDGDNILRYFKLPLNKRFE